MEAKKIKEIYDINKHKPANGNVNIMYDDGVCAIDSTVEIMGLEIDFQGKVEITPTLPEGWILQGNNSKILIFTLQNITIQKTQLFQYNGNLKITKIIASNPEGKRVIANPKFEKPTWLNQNWNLDVESKNWDNFKDKTYVGVLKQTKYNLPNYSLPKTKVSNKRINKKIKVKISDKSTPIQPSGSSDSTGGSSGGGY